MKTKLGCLEIGQMVKTPNTLPVSKTGARWGRGGFTLVEIMIVVTTIGILAGLAVPNYIKARTSAQVKACISNLTKINGAKAQWALENKKADTATPLTTDLAPYFNSEQMPNCPANGTYRLRRVSRIPSCSLYAIGHTMNNLDMDDDPLAD